MGCVAAGGADCVGWQLSSIYIKGKALCHTRAWPFRSTASVPMSWYHVLKPCPPVSWHRVVPTPLSQRRPCATSNVFHLHRSAMPRAIMQASWSVSLLHHIFWRIVIYHRPGPFSGRMLFHPGAAPVHVSGRPTKRKCLHEIRYYGISFLGG